MRWVLPVGWLCAVAGCGTGTDIVDALDAPGPGSVGLILEWEAKPSIPGPISGDNTVTAIKLITENLRVVGDAGPGDPRTQVGSLELDWDQAGVPPAVLFPDAPPGLYSQVVLKLEGDESGDDEAYEIRGTAKVGDDLEDFAILDDEILSIVVDCNVQLQANEQKTIRMEIDFGAAINEVDFSALPVKSNRRVLEPDDPQMPVFRAKLLGSFSVQDTSGSAN